MPSLKEKMCRFGFVDRTVCISGDVLLSDSQNTGLYTNILLYAGNASGLVRGSRQMSPLISAVPAGSCSLKGNPPNHSLDVGKIVLRNCGTS